LLPDDTMLCNERKCCLIRLFAVREHLGQQRRALYVPTWAGHAGRPKPNSNQLKVLADQGFLRERMTGVEPAYSAWEALRGWTHRACVWGV